MKDDNRAPLYPNAHIAGKVLEYSASNTATLPQKLLDYHVEIAAREAKSYYMISPFQAQGMIWLGRLVGAKKVLEIGVYVGFSSLCWSACVGPSGTVTGLECSSEYATAARDAFSKLGTSNIEVIEGDAAKILKSLSPAEPYDLIFIDADKSGYSGYLETILAASTTGSKKRLLKPGGLILADNVLRRGLVAYASEETLALTNKTDAGLKLDIEKLREFNDAVNNEPRLDAFLMPLWDGLQCARLVD